MATSNVNEMADPTSGAAELLPTGLACEAHDLKQILGHLADQIADADRRHSDALAGMQERLAALGTSAQDLREQLPKEMAPVLDRIEGGMAQLSVKIAEADGPRRMLAPATSDGQTAVEAAPALRSALAADALDAYARRAQASRTGTNAPIDHFDVVDSGSSPRDEEMWDNDAADALARLYDAGADATGEPAAGVAGTAEPEPEAVEPSAPPLVPAAAAAASANEPSPMDHLEVAPSAAERHADALASERQADALASERAWLDQRFSDIAARVEQSIMGLQPVDSIEAIEARFEKLEQNLSDVIGGTAKSADLAGLKNIETQVEDLTAQLVSVQTHFSRLDTIELELRSLADRMTSEGLAKIIEQSTPKAPDSEALAGAVANRVVQQMPRIGETLQSIATQLSAERIAGLIAQSKPSAPDAGAIARLVADEVSQRLPQHAAGQSDPSPQLEELREMIESFAADQRHGDEQTTTMLDTMQQALIRLLDRMEAMEQGQYVVDDDAQPEHELPGYPEAYRQPQSDHAGDPPAAASEPHPQQRRRNDGAEEGYPAVPQQARYETEPDAAHTTPPGTPRAGVEPVVASDPDQPSRAAGSRDDYIASARRAARMAAEAPVAAPEPVEEAPPRRAAGQHQHAKSSSGRPLSRVSMAMICLILVGASFIAVKSTLLAPSNPPPAVKSQTPVKGAAATTGPAEKGLHNLEDADVIIEDGTRSNARPAPDAVQRRSGLPGFGGPERDPSRAFDGALANAVPASQVQGQPGSGLPSSVPAALTRDTPSAAGVAKSKDMPPLTIGPNSLRTAAAKGDPSAEFEIGARFAEGRGVTQDLQQAITWYQRSAAQGFAPAQYRLASMYERGLGVKTDLARARVWYQRAAEQGVVKAMHNLAVLSAGRDSTITDYAAAAKWFQAAADHGLTDSQFNLAIMHDSGLGMERDAKLAFKWFTLAARAGDEEAARRRESLRQNLQPHKLAEADAAIAGWRPKSAEQALNDPRMAGEGWKSRTR